MTWFKTHPKSKLKISSGEEGKIGPVLDNVRNDQDSTNWMLLSYQDTNDELFFDESGSGGFDEMITRLGDNDVKYGVFRIVVDGDEYNTVKYMLLTWIGTNVSPGLGKARCAAHRDDLYNFVKTYIGIAGEYQPATRDDLTYEAVSAKLTSVSSQYHSTTSDTSVQTKMSRSHVTGKSGKRSKLSLDDNIADGLKKVLNGEANWCLFGYSDRETLVFKQVGSGDIGSLKEFFDPNEINFALFSFTFVPEDGDCDKLTKNLLISMVGDSVAPMWKAKSSGHRDEIQEYILAILPFHTQFQPNDKEDLTEVNLLKKLST